MISARNLAFGHFKNYRYKSVLVMANAEKKLKEINDITARFRAAKIKKRNVFMSDFSVKF
jgi:hypothetical protein